MHFLLILHYLVGLKRRAWNSLLLLGKVLLVYYTQALLPNIVTKVVAIV